MLISTLAQYQSKVTKLIVPSFLKIVFVNIKAEICIALCHKTMDLQVIKSLIVTVYLVLLRKTKLFQFLVKIKSIYSSEIRHDFWPHLSFCSLNREAVRVGQLSLEDWGVHTDFDSCVGGYSFIIMTKPSAYASFI